MGKRCPNCNFILDDYEPSLEDCAELACGCDGECWRSAHGLEASDG